MIFTHFRIFNFFGCFRRSFIFSKANVTSFILSLSSHFSSNNCFTIFFFLELVLQKIRKSSRKTLLNFLLALERIAEEIYGWRDSSGIGKFKRNICWIWLLRNHSKIWFIIYNICNLNLFSNSSLWLFRRNTELVILSSWLNCPTFLYIKILFICM